MKRSVCTPLPRFEVEDLREGIAKGGGPPAVFQQLLCGDKELQERHVLTPGVGVGRCCWLVFFERYSRDDKKFEMLVFH